MMCHLLLNYYVQRQGCFYPSLSTTKISPNDHQTLYDYDSFFLFFFKLGSQKSINLTRSQSQSSLDIYPVNLRSQSECEKIQTRKTPNSDTFYVVKNSAKYLEKSKQISKTELYLSSFREILNCVAKTSFLKSKLGPSLFLHHSKMFKL